MIKMKSFRKAGCVVGIDVIEVTIASARAFLYAASIMLLSRRIAREA
jgi:hypothetical protein